MTRSRSIPPGHTKSPIVRDGPEQPRLDADAVQDGWRSIRGNRKQHIALGLFFFVSFLIMVFQGDMTNFAMGAALTSAVIVAASDNPITSEIEHEFLSVIDLFANAIFPTLAVFVVGAIGMFLGQMVVSFIGPMWGFGG